MLIPERTAFVFPGQGSQSIGMGQSLAHEFPVAMEVFKQADDWLGFPLSRLAWEGPDEELNDTVNTQPALLVHSVAALRVLEEILPGYSPAFVAGHSMGELSALVSASALSYPETLLLVRRRGELMKRAGETSPGRMAAVLGLDISQVELICSQSSSIGEVVQVANDNCPGQVVISGSSVALERAIILAHKAGARRIVPLAVSIAAHSPLMQPAQDDFNLAVNQVNIVDPVIPIIGNVSAKPITTAAEIRADLQAQLTSPVRWTESIQYMVSQEIDTFFEVGNGSVLSGLIKRIHREARTFSIGNPDDFERLLKA